MGMSSLVLCIEGNHLYFQYDYALLSHHTSAALIERVGWGRLLQNIGHMNVFVSLFNLNEAFQYEIF